MLELLSIGNELLSGSTINTNSAYIAKRLKKSGFTIARQTVLGDDPLLLKEGLQEIVARSSLVLTTGGLGPTFDDITKQVVSELFQLPLIVNEEVAKELKKRYANFDLLQNQTLLPQGATLLPNPLGSAPGFILSISEKTLIAMPGVPEEMERMLEKEVIPYLERRFPKREKFFEEDLYFTLISEMDLDEILKKLQEENRGLQIGIYPSLSRIRIHLSVKEREEEQARKLLFVCREKLSSLFPHQLYHSMTGSIVEPIQKLFMAKEKKLAVAESCTGGAISHAITRFPHASSYFLGGVVAYTNEMKRDFLKVRETTLREKGAVSKETVAEMMDGLFHTTHADYALAVSGIAGPTGGTEDLPLGSVCIGVGKRGEKSDLGWIHVPGERSIVMEYSTHFALSLLWRRAAFHLLYFGEG